MLVDFQIYFWGRESYTLDWPRTHVSEVDLELLIILLLPPIFGIAACIASLAIFPDCDDSYQVNYCLELSKISWHPALSRRGFIL